MSSNLAISLVIGASVGAAIQGINNINSALAALRNHSLTTAEKMGQISALSKANLQTGVSVLTGLGASIGALAQPAIAFESAMADVKKVVDFDTPEGFQNLSKEILELTRTLPMTAEELAAITASGGQLGVAEQDLKAFTTTIAKMSVAFDMSAEDSGDAMAKLANVYKIPINEIGNLGDAINELSNSSPAKASDIVRTLGRIGGVAKQFGLTENAAAALANSFISLGKPPEVAGTAINGMLTKLMTADKGGKKFQEALDAMGLSAKEVKSAISKDAQGVLTDFLKKIEKLPKDKQMGILVDLFGLEYADDVAVLASNTKVLEDSLKTLQETDQNGKPKYLGSMEKEFAARAATTENNLRLLKNSFTEFGTHIGAALLPIINSLVDSVKPFILQISDWVSANKALVGSVLKVVITFTAAFGLINVGAGLLGYIVVGFLRFKKLFITGITVIGKLFLWLGRVFLLNPIGLAITAIAVAAYLIYRYWAPIKAFFTQLWAAITEKFQAAWAWIKSAWTGVGEWVANAWESVKAYFAGLWANLTALGQQGINTIGNFIRNFNPLALFQSAFSSVLSWFSIDLPNSFSNFGKNIIDGLVNGISQAWTQAKEKVSALGSGIKSWFAEKLDIHSPSRVFKGFGVNIVEGLAIGMDKAEPLASHATQQLSDTVSTGFPLSPPAEVASPLQAAFQTAQALQGNPNRQGKEQGQTQVPQAPNGTASGGITLHFSPNITLNHASSEPDLKTALRQALQDPAMLHPLEQLLLRVNDQIGRRAY